MYMYSLISLTKEDKTCEIIYFEKKYVQWDCYKVEFLE